MFRACAPGVDSAARRAGRVVRGGMRGRKWWEVCRRKRVAGNAMWAIMRSWSSGGRVRRVGFGEGRDIGEV